MRSKLTIFLCQPRRRGVAMRKTNVAEKTTGPEFWNKVRASLIAHSGRQLEIKAAKERLNSGEKLDVASPKRGRS